MTLAPAIQGTDSPRSLLANCGWSVIGTVGFSAAQLGWIAAIAQLGTASMVGRFALAIAITSPVVLVTNSALRTVQATDSKRGFLFGEYLAFRLASIALAMLTILGLSLLLEPELRPVLFAVAILKAWESLGDVIQGDLQRRERLDLVGISQLLKGIGSLVALAITLYATHSIDQASWAAAFAFAAVVLLYDLPALVCVHAGEGDRGALWPRWTRERLRSLLVLTFPLGLTVLCGALIANVPRYFIEAMLGEAPLGIFAALAWVAVIGQVLAGAVAHAALPRMSRLHAANDLLGFAGFLRRLLLAGAVSGLLAVPVSWVVGQSLLQLVFGTEYALRSAVFVILVAAMAFSILIVFLDHALYAARWFQVQAPINLIALAAISLACWLVVPRYGLIGTAWVVCITQAAQALVRWLIVRHVMGTMPVAVVNE